MLEYTMYSYNLIILNKKPHMLSIFFKQTLSWPKYSMHVIVLCQNLSCSGCGPWAMACISKSNFVAWSNTYKKQNMLGGPGRACAQVAHSTIRATSSALEFSHLK